MKKIFALVLSVLMLLSWALAAPAQNAVMIPIGEKTEIDLDNDGGMESVTLKMEGVDGEEYLALYLFGADGSFYEYPMYVYFMEEAWAQDLDGDGLSELFVVCDFYSDDYVVYCFRYTDAEGLSVIPFSALDRFDGAGADQEGGYGRITAVNGATITLRGSQDVVGTWMCDRDFTLVDGRFELQSGLFRMAVSEEDWEYRPLILKQSLEVTLADGSTGVFPAGEKLMPVSSDRESVLTLTTRDGITCSVEIARDTESGWGWYVNGVHENDLLEFVPYAD